jgi:hypothetical protein
VRERFLYPRLLVALLAVATACGSSEPTSWEEALREHPDLLESSLRLAHDETVLIQAYNEEYDAWRSVDDCNTLQDAVLGAIDDQRQNAKDRIAGQEVDRDGVPLDVSDDELLARMDAIAVVKAELECFS